MTSVKSKLDRLSKLIVAHGIIDDDGLSATCETCNEIKKLKRQIIEASKK